ncbi:MAG: hypothetical protein HC846_04900 [Blastocatellia bacterium]|nr:hypothetical protein [Blastocatellia bacterium]
METVAKEISEVKLKVNNQLQDVLERVLHRLNELKKVLPMLKIWKPI